MTVLLLLYLWDSIYKHVFIIDIRSIDPQYPKSYRQSGKHYISPLSIYKDVPPQNPNIFVNPTTYISQSVLFFILQLIFREDYGILGEFSCLHGGFGL